MTLRLPPLVSGGVMLSYHCSNACRHCLYRCSPRQPDEWLTPETADRIFAGLAREPELDSIHIAGGEPGLNLDLLVDVVGRARRARIAIAYVETNAVWCDDPDRTRREMKRLHQAGLRAILVSCSMFHSEFVPFRSTRNAVEIGAEVFGSSRVIVYMSHVYDILSRMPTDGTHPLAEFMAFAGVGDNWSALPGLYDVIPGGRVVTALRPCFAAGPASTFQRQACASQLLNTYHFHIDHTGNLFTGCCAGLVPSSAPDFHGGELTEREHPVFTTLCSGGPWALMDMARRDHGFKETAQGYISKCDLCFHVRQHLNRTGRFPELRPDPFYTA